MPTDLYPTKTRLTLLRDVADGETWQKREGESISTGLGRDVRVTAAIAELERAGWVHVVELRFGAKQWQLTAVGREVLAANDETEG